MGTSATLEFEKPIVELERQIDELKRLAGGQQMNVADELAPLEKKLTELREEIYKNLSPWQRVQVARYPKRPFTLDYIQLAFTDFVELHGDRAFREDPAIVGGWARLDGETAMIIGQQRGRDTKEILRRNFGMPHPEGYRKALRLMKLAEKFHVPVLTFIDTMGAWAGLGAEERGQSEAIARNLFEMSRLEVPIIATVIGEGGSGGALALGVSDRTNMFENAVYSVISVEGCAAILWKDGKSQAMREKAATALKITARELLELRVIDEIIPEPPGGAHANHEAAAAALHDTLVRQLEDLRRLKPDKLVRRRREKFLRMGQFLEISIPSMPHLIEVAFKGNRKDFFLWDAEEPPPLKAAVIVDADRGEDLGYVHALGELAEKRNAGAAHGYGVTATTTKKARRLATPDELQRASDLRTQDEDARRRAAERVKANQLVMKLSDAEWQWDRKKLTLYFTADKRVDFRTLVRELASMFRTRIELKQIGVRDEAKRLDGIGRCGRQYCSSSWLPELRPVNLGVAKDQRLSLNPSQISGACGRLMCCLRYEHEFYVQSRKRFPKEGRIIRTKQGEEKVLSNDIFRERVTLRRDDGEMRVVPLGELRAEMDAAGFPLPAVAVSAPLAEDEDVEIEADELELVEGGEGVDSESDNAVETQVATEGEPPAGETERKPHRRRGRRGGRRNRQGRGGQPGGGSDGSAPPQGA